VLGFTHTHLTCLKDVPGICVKVLHIYLNNCMETTYEEYAPSSPHQPLEQDWNEATTLSTESNDAGNAAGAVFFEDVVVD